ncbi:MAG: Rpp14/Pop5 family protein [Candidatus Parvarchaeota archaeon]|jgi:RNase P/RNase MRP subunit POP5|nr:Rpp14/Pop5 family protein [Candidatus Parvarchaeota archaeon]MCL5106695.1 Rpp14/Pop5 family protein [Candidatus Parvarchaeota archaeon]
MRYKKRYFLVEIDGISSQEDFEKQLYSTLNRMEPFLAIRSNFRVIKDMTKFDGSRAIGVIAVNNEYKYRVIFSLSLISKFYKSNLLTIMNSGNIKKIKSFKF